MIEKLINENITRVNRLLEAAGNPEFIQLTKHNVWLAGTKIEIKDNWYKATTNYINHNIVVEPGYYFDLYQLFDDGKFGISTSEPVNEYEYIYLDWREGETIGSGMLTLTSKQFKQFENGKLNKMLVQYLKEKFDITKYNWKENLDKFLAKDDDVIHIIISVHDQDTTANIRHFVYDNPEGDHVDEAMRHMMDRTDVGDLLNFSY